MQAGHPGFGNNKPSAEKSRKNNDKWDYFINSDFPLGRKVCNNHEKKITPKAPITLSHKKEMISAKYTVITINSDTIAAIKTALLPIRFI